MRSPTNNNEIQNFRKSVAAKVGIPKAIILFALERWLESNLKHKKNLLTNEKGALQVYSSGFVKHFATENKGVISSATIWEHVRGLKKKGFIVEHAKKAKGNAAYISTGEAYRELCGFSPLVERGEPEEMESQTEEAESYTEAKVIHRFKVREKKLGSKEYKVRGFGSAWEAMEYYFPEWAAVNAENTSHRLWVGQFENQYLESTFRNPETLKNKLTKYIYGRSNGQKTRRSMAEAVERAERHNDEIWEESYRRMKEM